MKFDFEPQKFRVKTNLKVRYSDLDTMNHVNNAKYLSYLEEARIDYFRQLTDYPQNRSRFDYVVARVDISYLAPLELGDSVIIHSRVAKIGKKSLEIHHAIEGVREDEKFLAATAVTYLVSYDSEKKSSVPIPEETKKLITRFEENLTSEF